ncbi:MAG: patatin-like phospholipase family protein [Rhodospirillaceae bacterium]|nr:patatin-like phospholipase family protein [Rhodospirillales bacterium]
MGWTPPILPLIDTQTLFKPKADDLAKGTFELALVMGGTVSAGAYTAGVVDFLFQALDAWAADPEGPNHRTVLKVVSGSSGGAVCGALTSVLTGYQFPHTFDTASSATGNPLFDLWVNTLDIKGMLATDDIKKGKPLPSLLNCAPLNQGISNIIHYDGPKVASRRKWLDDTLPTLLTMTNLRGVPYATDMGNGGKEVFVDHADFGRFQVATTVNGVAENRPDSFVIGSNGTASRQDLADCAAASAAFPAGFVARQVVKPMGQYAYNVETVTNGNGTVGLMWQEPDWDSMRDPTGELPSEWFFASYDGGAIDNEPMELARKVLAGYVEPLPSCGAKAQRAVLLIDPFADPPSLGPAQAGGMLSMLGPFVSGLVAQGRYDTSDLSLAADPDRFDRFMINAVRGKFTGSKAIASAGLGAFQGFLCRDFRVHDYMLGRLNAYNYLKDILALPENNPLFDDWTPAQRDKYRTACGELPIIPLVDSVSVPATPNWPKGALNPETLREGISKRIDAVIEALEDEVLDPAWYVRLYLCPGIKFAESTAADAAMTAIKTGLDDWGL